jgi:transcriptional regulator with XRE-family HTH domain
MDQRLQSYTRSLRRRWGFTQRELAFLTGIKSGTVISRLEGMKRTPTLGVALACAVIFGVGPPELFPGIVVEVQRSILLRATTLYEELQGNASETTRVKLDFLEVLLARLEEEDNTGDI